MGEVYRTRHTEIGTEHAIKIVRPDLATNDRIMELFRREASVLRTVRDDAIVGYDGVLRDEEGRVYLVMEFVDIVREGRPFFSLEAEFMYSPLFAARNMGVDEEWLERLDRNDGDQEPRALAFGHNP